MSRQIRTWHEHDTDEEPPRRWDVHINGKAVPGGYIIQKSDDAFEIHYPHLEPKTFASLDEAKRRIELAPPIMRGDLAVAHPVADDDTELLSAEEAGELLGASRYRINAMVANGVLAGKRSGGKTFVSRESVEARIAHQEPVGPIGKFAHTFICYYPDSGATPWIMAEVDPHDSCQLDDAKRFLQSIADGEIPGQADAFDYRRAMALRAKARREHGETADFTDPIPIKELIARFQPPTCTDSHLTPMQA